MEGVYNLNWDIHRIGIVVVLLVLGEALFELFTFSWLSECYISKLLSQYFSMKMQTVLFDLFEIQIIFVVGLY